MKSTTAFANYKTYLFATVHDAKVAKTIPTAAVHILLQLARKQYSCYILGCLLVYFYTVNWTAFDQLTCKQTAVRK